ncbi:hypothetical protein SAMN04487997_3148 [Frateuria terrea]|uniref:Uncharacterized protein n=1 Tax=Frateuria terrea TaxID=529704 RepID=A0A1H6Y8H2_9GAMM|nr:hypothetical protein SAMN04487997_3148 [Frateuria terrea]SFP48991.1 hypothetical protein SAMN02927913_2293 [Frateuria terrea]
MHIDESLPSSRPPASSGSIPSVIHFPRLAKAPATPGGIPPMFAGHDARPAAPRRDAPEH